MLKIRIRFQKERLLRIMSDKKIKFLGLEIFISIILIILAFLIYLNVKPYLNRGKTRQNINSIKDYPYLVYKSDTKLFKAKYKELKKVLEASSINDKEYAKLIGELFTIDFYTLDNKEGRSDVGGLQFIHKDIRDNFKSKAEDTLYKYLTTDNKKKINTVTSVQTEAIVKERINFKGNTDFNGYKMIIRITSSDSTYQNKVKLELVHDGNLIEIIKVN